MIPDTSINDLIRAGKKDEAAKVALDGLRQLINNGIPYMSLTKDEWAYILPSVISQAQAATPEVDPSAPTEEEEEDEDDGP